MTRGHPTFGLVGVSCLTLGLLQLYVPSQTGVIIALFIFGKFWASITMSAIYMIMAESFPAECRALGTF